MTCELIVVISADPLVRWFVSRMLAYLHSDHEFIDRDLTRRWCLRLIEDPSELANKSFVWELPLDRRRLQGGLRCYEEDFIAYVLSHVCRLSSVIVVATGLDVVPPRIERLCTQSVVAELVPGAICCRRYDYRTHEKSVLRVELK